VASSHGVSLLQGVAAKYRFSGEGTPRSQHWTENDIMKTLFPVEAVSKGGYSARWQHRSALNVSLNFLG
jgi:hypothetical protein